MAAPFSLDDLARVRLAAQRLADRTAEHEGALHAYLSGASLSIDSANQLCLEAKANHVAAERLVADLGGPGRAETDDTRRRLGVLVVDDYDDNRDWLSMVVASAGFVVRTASNGLEAVIAAYELRPVVIVMDVMMPVLDGIEATRLIKEIDDLRTIPVIAYTAKSLQPPQANLFSEILSKPSPPDVVLSAIKRLAIAS